MGYKIEVRPDDLLVIETWDENYNPQVDGPRAAQEIIQIMDTFTKPVAVIVDMRAANLTFDDILLLASMASSKNAPARHLMQRRRIIVTDSSVVSLAAEGLDSEVFGHIAVDIATSMEQAFEMAQE